MAIQDFITELFCRVDDAMTDVPKHSQASLHPGEVVTLALLFAIKGVGNRAFYRWVHNNHRPEFPLLPERTRLFRLFLTHQQWLERFMADPTVLGVADTYGIELIHPYREGRSSRQIGRKGSATIVGSWEASWLWRSTSGAWWSLGTATQPTSMTRPSNPWWPSSKSKWWYSPTRAFTAPSKTVATLPT